VTDLAVQPKTGNAFLSVMRGQGAGAKAVLLRVDGAGKIEVVDFAKTTATKVMLPNPAQRVEGIGRTGTPERDRKNNGKPERGGAHAHSPSLKQTRTAQLSGARARLLSAKGAAYKGACVVKRRSPASHQAHEDQVRIE
jgi:hypothetical protein